ncbi:hypothetical protein FD20_GL000637 [Liquorilactobacillus uvarum DSM 19971]|uniref:HTH hxlR-type domain-containing protein n=2 Tax=Liquorilactobacillus uvarum TaxID=303240 RepID=A0A0R1PXE9_9LACO|nr:hypothetical protein FD20_GL000637 [Liquorilactobacillus uvarum DSM 19971]
MDGAFAAWLNISNIFWSLISTLGTKWRIDFRSSKLFKKSISNTPLLRYKVIVLTKWNNKKYAHFCNLKRQVNNMQTTDEWSCGVSKVMDVFAGKWKLNILWIIYNEEGIRFNQLKNRTVGITNIMLTRSLETLTSEKIISNNLIGNKPPFKSEYYLTTKGKSLVPLMQSLNDWGKNNL